MSPEATLPPAGILTEIIEPAGPMESPEFARTLLSLHLKPEAKERIRELLRKKNAGTLTPPEQRTLEEYLVTGELLDLLHAQARRALQRSDSSSS